MQDSKKLSIVIVNYRSASYLKACLISVLNNLKNIDFEVIVVNNDEREKLEKLKTEFQEIKLINHQKNIGFGAANNLGAQVARGEVLLFLNPDTELINDEAISIINRILGNRKIGVIGARLITEKRETQKWCAGKDITLWQLIKNNFGIVESKKIWESKKKIFTDWVSGAAFFVRKDVFKMAGGFGEDFFMYYEDVDLCARIRKLGYKVLFCPEVSILHKGGKSRKNLITQKMQFFKALLVYLRTKTPN